MNNPKPFIEYTPHFGRCLFFPVTVLPGTLGLQVHYIQELEMAVINKVSPNCAIGDAVTEGNFIYSINGKRLKSLEHVSVGNDKVRTLVIMVVLTENRQNGTYNPLPLPLQERMREQCYMRESQNMAAARSSIIQQPPPTVTIPAVPTVTNPVTAALDTLANSNTRDEKLAALNNITVAATAATSSPTNNKSTPPSKKAKVGKNDADRLLDGMPELHYPLGRGQSYTNHPRTKEFNLFLQMHTDTSSSKDEISKDFHDRGMKFILYDEDEQVWNVLEKENADEILWAKLSSVEKKRKRSVDDDTEDKIASASTRELEDAKALLHLVSENTKLKANLRDKNEKILENAETLLRLASENSKLKESLRYKDETIAQLKTLSTSFSGNGDSSANTMITNLAEENSKLKEEIGELKVISKPLIQELKQKDDDIAKLKATIQELRIAAVMKDDSSEGGGVKDRYQSILGSKKSETASASAVCDNEVLANHFGDNPVSGESTPKRYTGELHIDELANMIAKRGKENTTPKKREG